MTGRDVCMTCGVELDDEDLAREPGVCVEHCGTEVDLDPMSPPAPPPPPPSMVRSYRCSGCGVINRAINDLTGITHTYTDKRPSGCTGRYGAAEP